MRARSTRRKQEQPGEQKEKRKKKTDTEAPQKQASTEHGRAEDQADRLAWLVDVAATGTLAVSGAVSLGFLYLVMFVYPHLTWFIAHMPNIPTQWGASLLIFAASGCFTIRRVARNQLQWTVVLAVLAVYGGVLSNFPLRPLLWSNSDLRLVRVGAAGDSWARILVRDPSCPRAQLSLHADPDAEAPLEPRFLPEMNLTDSALASADYTRVLLVSDLLAGTRYVARLACLSGEHLDARFKTAPSPHTASDVVFAFGSCVFRWWEPLEGALQLTAGVEEEAGADPVLSTPDFALLLGDTIYADHPVWLGGGKEVYEAQYRDTYADESFAAGMRATSTLFIWDDHEIYDNNEAHRVDRPTYDAARAAFVDYAADTNPPPRVSGELYFSYAYGPGVSLFVLDLNSHRSPMAGKPGLGRRGLGDLEDGSSRTMLGGRQKKELFDWLQVEEERSSAAIKFIASPQTFTFTNRDPYAWFGYSAERDEILDWIEAHNISNVVLLSGDVHYSALVEVRPGLFELIASPIDAFTMVEPLEDLISDADGEVVHFAHMERRMHGRVRVSDSGKVEFTIMVEGAPIFSRQVLPHEPKKTE